MISDLWPCSLPGSSPSWLVLIQFCSIRDLSGRLQHLLHRVMLGVEDSHELTRCVRVIGLTSGQAGVIGAANKIRENLDGLVILGVRSGNLFTSSR